MAQIVCVKYAKEGLNNVGDIISIHDDDVELSGSGYALADIVVLKGISASEVRTKLNSLVPEQKTLFKTSVAANTWSDVRPEEKRAWKDKAGDWNFLEQQPKYIMNIGSLTTEDRQTLADKTALVADKDNIILSKARDNISYDSNNLVKVTDMNPVKVLK